MSDERAAERGVSNQRLQRFLSRRGVQPKLTVNAPGDEYEREAERVADAVMRMPAPKSIEETPTAELQADRVQRMCSRCERRYRQGKPLNCKECEEKLQRREASGQTPPVDAELEREIESVRGGGTRLPSSVRSFFEPRFGEDFSDVRVHTDARADAAARAVQAEAFTVGRDVAFRSGAYQPGTEGGRRLLAHELTHVVQQDRAGTRPTVQRQSGMSGQHIDPMDQPRMHPEDTEEQEQAKVNAQQSSACNVPSNCPDHFCTPYDKVSYARHMRTELMPTLLTGIGGVVSPRVVPVWHNYLMGGDSKQDFTGRFGDDFKNSDTTEEWTNRMKTELETELTSRTSTLQPGDTLDISALIPSFITSLGTPGVGIDFNVPGEIPGNLAGGIGDDQSQCQVGAQPSTIDDDRTADGTVDIARTDSGDLEVTPSITYTVTDTVDLCPGNCGISIEQSATVPMSQFEATGISGDVPFEVRFPAPMDPFTISTGSSGGSSSSSGP